MQLRKCVIFLHSYIRQIAYITDDMYVEAYMHGWIYTSDGIRFWSIYTRRRIRVRRNAQPPTPRVPPIV